MAYIVSMLNKDCQEWQSYLPLKTGKIAYMRRSIGDRVKDAREAKGWSQQRLGDAVGVSRAAVSQWESGESKGLKPENLLATAQVLNVRIQWLVNEDGPMRAEPPMTINEMEMLELFRELSTEQQQSLLNLLGRTGDGRSIGNSSIVEDLSTKSGRNKLRP